jgi:hypothetical protein
MDATRRKWETWLERIGEDLLDLAVCTHIYRELTKIVVNNPDLQVPSTYWYFQHLTYEHYAVAAVRRQVKDKDDSISLARLLRELANQPNFAVHAIETQAVTADLERLKASLSELEHAADRRVAHLDKRPPPERPEELKVYEAVDALLDVFQRYRIVILDGPWDFNLPASAGNWRSLFKRPWIREE